MKTAVCAVVKNEERFIGEWVAHHLVLGFDTILIYDNGSSDGTTRYLSKAALLYDVRVLPWITDSADFQVKAYEAGLDFLKAESDWIMFIDIDEFFVPRRDNNVRSFLQNFDDCITAIAVPELFFGTSGLTNRTGDLVIRSYLHRAPDDFGPNRNVKSFVRPKHVLKANNPHYFTTDGAYTGVDGEAVVWLRDGVSESVRRPDIACVNHYFTRSRKDWDDKIARGYQDGTTRSEADFEYYDRNEVLDDGAAQYAIAVEEILIQIEGFEPSSYLSANPDVAKLKINPRQHYFQRGREERRPLGLRSLPMIDKPRNWIGLRGLAGQVSRQFLGRSQSDRTDDKAAK